MHVMEEFYLNKKFLSDMQADLLVRLSETLTGKDLEIMQQILQSFSKPDR